MTPREALVTLLTVDPSATETGWGAGPREGATVARYKLGKARGGLEKAIEFLVEECEPDDDALVADLVTELRVILDGTADPQPEADRLREAHATLLRAFDILDAIERLDASMHVSAAYELGRHDERLCSRGRT